MSSLLEGASIPTDYTADEPVQARSQPHDNLPSLNAESSHSACSLGRFGQRGHKLGVVQNGGWKPEPTNPPNASKIDRQNMSIVDLVERDGVVLRSDRKEFLCPLDRRIGSIRRAHEIHQFRHGD